MCIEASKSSDFYGKDVELHGLKKVEMNGCLGVVGGYDPDTQRRAVYLTDAEREVWVKPKCKLEIICFGITALYYT